MRVISLRSASIDATLPVSPSRHSCDIVHRLADCTLIQFLLNFTRVSWSDAEKALSRPIMTDKNEITRMSCKVERLPVTCQQQLSLPTIATDVTHVRQTHKYDGAVNLQAHFHQWKKNAFLNSNMISRSQAAIRYPLVRLSSRESGTNPGKSVHEHFNAFRAVVIDRDATFPVLLVGVHLILFKVWKTAYAQRTSVHTSRLVWSH